METIPDTHKDLLSGQVATLATVGRDGRPQLSEVWFVANGDDIVISLNTSRQKTKNLLAHPGCCLFILDLQNPARYLELRGDAEVTPDNDFRVVDEVQKKYGADVRSHDGPGDERVVVKLLVKRVNAVDMSA